MNNHSLGIFILASLTAYFWVNVYLFGFFQTIMWSIIIAAIVGIYLRLSGKR
tara:strand:- start:588 stop:743 length:156 start_codon:yes stop_codon:yes gene_type:complete